MNESKRIDVLETAVSDALSLIGTPTRLCLGRYSNARNVLAKALESDSEPHPDSAFCSRCREHADFEENVAPESGWFSVCCGWPPVDMGD